MSHKKKSKVEQAAKELFGEMRSMTEEEQKMYSEHLKKISVPVDKKDINYIFGSKKERNAKIVEALEYLFDNGQKWKLEYCDSIGDILAEYYEEKGVF